MQIIRQGRIDDYECLIQRVTLSFAEDNPTHQRFDIMFPDTVRPTDESMRQWLFAEVDGDIAAGMQVVPRPLVIAGEIGLDATGLANVFTYPPYRRQGLMSALLKEAIAQMERNHVPINMLGGDRLRYGRFGWEIAGSVRQLTLSPRMLRDREPCYSAVDFRRWEGEPKDVQQMLQAYQRLPYRVQRSEEEFTLLLARPGVTVWISETGEAFAYVALRGDAVAEYAGDRIPLEALIQFLAGRRQLSVTIPPVDAETELEQMLLGYASGFQIAPVANVRIISLHDTLQAYLPILQRRLRGWKGKVTLAIRDGNQLVTIAGTGGDIVVSSEEGERVLSLSLREAAWLLFGPFSPVRGDWLDDEFLRRAFPLPLFYHSLSRV